jgi:hypothetical protein
VLATVRRVLSRVPSEAQRHASSRLELEVVRKRLTARLQLQRIQLDRAVDTSEASASACSVTSLPAANSVRQHEIHLSQRGEPPGEPNEKPLTDLTGFPSFRPGTYDASLICRTTLLATPGALVRCTHGEPGSSLPKLSTTTLTSTNWHGPL